MTKHVFSSNDWQDREDRFWANFFNTLSGFRSSVLIGTTGKTGVQNLAIFNSLVHLGAHPPLLGFILRPTTVPRGTYENILETGYYSLNHITEKMLDAAHQTSAKYDNETSEFEAVKLTPELGIYPAPYVAESPVKMMLKFEEEHLIQRNGTRLIAGEIVEVRLDKNLMEEDGSIKMAANKLLATSGLYHYHSVDFLKKKDYAKP